MSGYTFTDNFLKYFIRDGIGSPWVPQKANGREHLNQILALEGEDIMKSCLLQMAPTYILMFVSDFPQTQNAPSTTARPTPMCEPKTATMLTTLTGQLSSSPPCTTASSHRAGGPGKWAPSPPRQAVRGLNSHRMSSVRFALFDAALLRSAPPVSAQARRQFSHRAVYSQAAFKAFCH